MTTIEESTVTTSSSFWADTENGIEKKKTIKRETQVRDKNMSPYLFTLRNRTSFKTVLELWIAIAEMLNRVVFLSSSTSLTVVVSRNLTASSTLEGLGSSVGSTAFASGRSSSSSPPSSFRI